MKTLYNSLISRFWHLGVIFALITECMSCAESPDVGGLYYFGWNSDRGHTPFYIRRPDSSDIDTLHITGTAFYEADAHNLWCLDSTQLRLSNDDNPYISKILYPLFIHRASSRTDTLFLPLAIHSRNSLDFGHIHRECFLDEWVILECRLPGRILGYNYLFDEAYRGVPLDELDMSLYTYEGQRQIFESDDFDYWLINRMTTDLYGPLSEENLVDRMKELEVPLPVTLKSMYFSYEQNHKDGEYIPFPDSMYTHFLILRFYPHGEKAKPKEIGNH